MKPPFLYHRFIATGGYSGYFPKAPGTFATGVGILLYWPVHSQPVMIQILLILILFFHGVHSSSVTEREVGKKDPSFIVIDEIIGIWLSLFLIPFQWPFVLLAFILFRILDIRKPFWIRPLQRLEGGWGIVLDDCLAGIYTNLALEAIRFLIRT